jgi:hypothetical protein
MSMPGRDCITTSGGLAAVHVARIKAAALADKQKKSKWGREWKAPFTDEAERGMTQDEFNKTAIRTEDSVSEIWDLRPFEGQQSKAFEYLLQNIDTQLRDGTLATKKRIIVLHDSRLVMSLPTLTWIKQLQALGVPLDFKIEDS